MWSVEWEQPGLTAHLDMCSLSPSGVLFNTNGTKHEPPDPTELDPDLLRTLNMPQRTSIDSLDSESDAAMMDNWQMNEVFQDISSILTETNEESTADCDRTADVDQLVKEIFDTDSADIADLADYEMTAAAADTSVDLSWIIKETLGDDALLPEQTLGAPTTQPIDDGMTIDYGLLDELEALGEDAQVADCVETPSSPASADLCSAASISSSPRSSISDSEESASVIAIDHQYTQLASVTAKPHETKKEAIRRVKNNAASRVCRRQRKNRLTTNMDKVAELTATNTELLQRIKDVESVVCLLKDHLVKATRQK